MLLMRDPAPFLIDRLRKVGTLFSDRFTAMSRANGLGLDS